MQYTERFGQFKELVNLRFTCKTFKPDPIPDDVVNELLHLARRAPSSFNTQPYRIVLVRDKAQREKLAQVMTGTNGKAVNEAPVVTVFCADTEITRENKRLLKLVLTNPKFPRKYAAIMPK